MIWRLWAINLGMMRRATNNLGRTGLWVMMVLGVEVVVGRAKARREEVLISRRRRILGRIRVD
jgi:hypothetical protein